MLKSIMIVDDSDADQFIIENLVGKIDETVQLYKSWDGQEAIEFLEDFDTNKEKYKDKFPPSMILLDINMPRMNGFEFLEKYAEYTKSKKLEAVPVVMFTSSNEQVDRVRVEKYDFVKEYVVKPLSLDGLLNMLKVLRLN